MYKFLNVLDTQYFIPKSLQNKPGNFSYTWKAPSNIALVKYWGKITPQIPKNASISFTLEHSHTITTIDFSPKDPSQHVLESQKKFPTLL